MNESRKLLYIGVFDPHVPLSGTGQRARHLLGGLSRRYTIDAVYIEGNGRTPVPEIAERFADGLPDVRRKVAVPFSRLKYFVFHPGVYRAAREFVESEHYDAVLCDYGLAAAYGLGLARRYDLPFIYLSHNVEHRGHLQKARADPRRLALFPWMYGVERLGVKHSKLLVAITESEAKFYERWKPADRIVVVPQGFDEKDFHPHYDWMPGDRKVVLFCGNFGIQFNREGVRAMVDRVVDRVVARHPEAEFRMVGAHPPIDIEHPAVTYTGFVDDYAAELRASDVFVTPVKAAVGFPTKVIEALACGKPVVATPEGARSIAPDYRGLHLASLDEFAPIINRLLDERPDPETGDFERIRGAHTWDALVDRLYEAIEGSFDDHFGLSDSVPGGGLPGGLLQ